MLPRFSMPILRGVYGGHDECHMNFRLSCRHRAVCPPDTDPSVIVGNVMDALAVSWEGESLAQKPTIERVMSAILAALVELKLTICEAPYILDHQDGHGLRRYAIENARDGFTRS